MFGPVRSIDGPATKPAKRALHFAVLGFRQKQVSKSEEVGTTFGYSTKKEKKKDQDSGTCLWSPAKEEIASSTETKVPAKVPKNRPYLRVSLIPMAIASLFEKSPVLLNRYIPRSNQIKSSKKIPKSDIRILVFRLTILYLDLRRAKRAKIEKIANPPLIPVPMENALMEATVILRSFSDFDPDGEQEEERSGFIELDPLQ